MLVHFEGFRSDNAGDAGGDTVYGISHAENPEIKPWPPSLEDAKAWYRAHYWDPHQLDTMPYAVAARLFLFAVNVGGEDEKLAIVALERALNRLGEKLPADGILSDAVHAAVTIQAAAHGDDLLARLRAEIATYHVQKVIADPAKEAFLAGWLWRDCW